MRHAPLKALLVGAAIGTLVAAGCGESSSAPNPVEPAGDVTGGGEEPGGAVTPAAAPSVALMATISRDRDALASRLDPGAGLVLVEYFEDASGEDPAAGPDGLVQRGERLCGEALDGYMERLARDLGNRIENTSYDPLFTCEAMSCTFPAEMEYDLSGQVYFRHGEDGGLVLDAVVRIEGGPVTDEFLQTGRRFADQQRQALAGGRCPEP